MSRSQARSAPRRTRTEVSYAESSTAEDQPLEESDLEPERFRPAKRRRVVPAQSSNRSTRGVSKRNASRAQVSYFDPSDESDIPFQDSDPEPERTRAPPVPRIRTSRTVTAASRSNSSQKAVLHGNTSRVQKRRAPKPRNSRNGQRPIRSTQPEARQAARPATSCPPVTQEPAKHIPTDGIIPAWQTLPYEILLQIFQYAARPAHQSSRHWLVKTARLCRAFAEPALAALYYSPLFISHIETHQFLALLNRDPTSTAINYAVKVRRMDVEASVLSHTGTKLGIVSLADLAGACPQLEAMHVTSTADQPPFRAHPSTLKLLHPNNFLPGFEQHGVRLKSWRWNVDLMISGDHTSANQIIKTAHESRVFQDLTHLEISRASVEPKHISPKKNKAVGDFITLPQSLAPLTRLSSLSLESCEGEDWGFLSELPTSLQHVRITNNGFLSSGDVEAFLESHGSGLLTLDLSHNQYLDLAFVARLRTLCPKLQELRLDATYYSAVALDRDLSPLYDDLLPGGLTPTWPKSLRSLELLNLRKWQQAAAEAFFQSLQHSALELNDLRYIVVRAMLSIGWRDRAAFREKYIHSMQRVFKRRSHPPSPELASHRCARLYKAKLQTKNDSASKGQAMKSTAAVAIGPTVKGQAPDVINTRSGRITQQAQYEELSSSEQDVEEVEESEESARSDKGGPEDGLVQGMCEVVEISVDNLRPAEFQFNERDFMDSEESGDEDWHEGAEERLPTPTYAW